MMIYFLVFNGTQTQSTRKCLSPAKLYSREYFQPATTHPCLETELKALQKQVQKLEKSKRSKSGKKRPGPTLKPNPLTPAACKVLGLEEGTSLTRIELTKAIFAYKKEKFPDCNTKGKGKDIPYDKPLFDALNIPADFPLGMLSLQKFTKHAFQ